MRSLVFGTVVLLALLVSLPASAQHYDHRWTGNFYHNHPLYYGSQRNVRGHVHRHHYNYRHHRSRNYRSSDVAIALGAGLLIGSAIDRSRQPRVVYHQPVQPVYYQPIYHRPQQHRCRVREIRTYDVYGRLIGVRTVCQ